MIIQGSDEWRRQRLGKVTASRLADVIAKTKSGWGASRANYMAELIAERLTGVPADRYTNSAMAWGTETEPQARAAYEFYHSVEVEEVGFIDHPKILMTGCSPDGLVGNGLVEIKCPNTATHIETLLSEKVQDKYVVQMLWQMECTDRAWCDFVSYDPRMPEHLALFVKRVRRDDARLKEISMTVTNFLAEVERKVACLESIGVSDTPVSDLKAAASA
jgi:putative phage-type endonuclease